MEKLVACSKCGGSGYVSPRVSRGCAGDVCFRCNGQGSVKYRAPRKPSTPKEYEKMTCFAAVWVVNGETKGFGNGLYRTIEQAQAEAATFHPACGQYEGREVTIVKSAFNLGRLR